MSKKEYDPLDRIRTLNRILPALAGVLLFVIPTLLWLVIGFIAMEWDVSKWVGEGRFAYVFISVAGWLLSVFGIKEFCKEKLKYSSKY